jgi:hypothetical protein
MMHPAADAAAADDGQGDEDGTALVATDHDRRGRDWMLFAEVLDGMVVGGFTTVDGTIIFSGEFLRAQAIYRGGTSR